jgi:hypothetical protein
VADGEGTAGERLARRISGTRRLLSVAAAIMAVLLLTSSFVTAVPIPGSRHHPAQKQRLGSRPHNERPGCLVLLRVSVHVG